MLEFIIAIIIYFIGVAIALDNETTITELDPYSSFGVRSTNREATTLDAWKALFWPLKLLYVILISLLACFNDILNPILLLIGFKYKNTKFYKYIEKHI